jgi:hypothetical protein
VKRKKGWLERLPSLPEDGERVSRRFAVVQTEGKIRADRQLQRVPGQQRCHRLRQMHG